MGSDKMHCGENSGVQFCSSSLARCMVPASMILVLFLGCTAKRTEVADPQQSESTAKEIPFKNGNTAHEDVRLIDGTLGAAAVASGIVVSADGAPCVGATVTADFVDRKDGLWIKPGRCLYVTSDYAGRYEIRGEGTKGQSVFWATANGQLGASYTPEKIQLRGGETIVYVRDEAGQPIKNANVTVYESGVDDMSFSVPPNIRKLLQRTTDEDGVVRYPSRLGDYDLGFEVKTPQGMVFSRGHYNGVGNLPHKLFVVSEDQAVVDRCRATLAGELRLDPDKLYDLQVGRPGHDAGL